MKNETEINEGNKLIATFMNHKWVQEFEKHTSKEDKFPYEKLKYHSSWDWLIPVVHKISKMETEAGMNWLNINVVAFGGLHIAHMDIDEVFHAVVKFITDYNKHNLNPESKP